MANGKNGKKKKDVDFLEGMDLSFSDATGTGKKNMGFGDMGMPDVNLKMDLGLDNLKGSGKGQRMDLGLENLGRSGRKKDPLDNLKSSKNDFGDFDFGPIGPKKRKNGKEKPLLTDKDVQRAKEKIRKYTTDPRSSIEKKLGLPKGYRKTLQEARESGEINGRSDTEKAVAGAEAIRDKEDYEKLKEQRKQARRNTPIRRGIRKIHQKLKDIGEEKPPKPKSNGNGSKSNGNSTAKPTQKQLPIPSKWRIVIEKDGQQRAHWFDTLNDAQSAKAGYVANGFRLVSMSKHSIN